MQLDIDLSVIFWNIAIKAHSKYSPDKIVT
jgi:hypothetical protein